MKKLLLISLVLIASSFFTVSAVTVGGLGKFYPSGFSGTFSMDKVEVELSITDLFSGKLDLSADYSLFTKGLGSNFFMDFGVGAGITFNQSGFGLNVIAPFEFGFKIKEILKGMDIYLQPKVVIPLYPKPSFSFEAGLGVRVGL